MRISFGISPETIDVIFDREDKIDRTVKEIEKNGGGERL